MQTCQHRSSSAFEFELRLVQTQTFQDFWDANSHEKSHDAPLIKGPKKYTEKITAGAHVRFLAHQSLLWRRMLRSQPATPDKSNTRAKNLRNAHVATACGTCFVRYSTPLASVHVYSIDLRGTETGRMCRCHRELNLVLQGRQICPQLSKMPRAVGV